MARTLVALSLVVPAACRSEPAGSGASALERRLRTCVVALCEAGELAGEGSVDAAGDVFEDRAHAFLHDLADRVASVDRGASAELLEAKQRVEAELAGGRDAAALSEGLSTLRLEVREAAGVLDLDAPGCQEAA